VYGQEFQGINLNLFAFPVALAAAVFAYFLVQYLVGNAGLASAVKKNPIPIIVAACVLLLVFYGVEGKLVSATVHAEVVSIIVQFLFLIVLGGAVTALYQERLQKRERDEREIADRANITELDRQILRAMHDDLVSAYNKAKRVRWLVNARLEYSPGDAASPYVPKTVYDEQMEALLDAELDFESILRRVASNVALFGEDASRDGSLDRIESYLKQTVKEYGDELHGFDGDESRRSLAELPKLAAFLGFSPDTEQTGFKPGGDSKQLFRQQFEKVIQFLRTEINKRARRINRTGDILWVDDQPDNNRYEIQQLGVNGYSVVKAKSTDGAVKLLSEGKLKPILIISDMVRREPDGRNPEAGLELLKQIKDLPDYKDTPVFFYVSYATVGKYLEAVTEAGGQGITDSRLQLFKVIDDCAEAVERGNQLIMEETD
jgi:CheY-like chemotaxis protein